MSLVKAVISRDRPAIVTTISSIVHSAITRSALVLTCRLLAIGIIGIIHLHTSAAQSRSSDPTIDADLRSRLAEPEVRFDRLGSRDGLSHNTVLSIIQDRHGFMWFGTADGLNRYDGYGFEVYRHYSDDTTSLSDNTIRALAEDGRGRLWVATASGLCRFDRPNDAWVRYRFPGSEADGFRDVQSLVVDAEGTLWVYTYANKLYRFDDRSDALDLISPWADLHRRPRVLLKPFLDADGRLWVPSADTSHRAGASSAAETRSDWVLHRYEPGRDEFQTVDIAPSAHQSIEAPFTTRVGESGTLWMTHPALHVLATHDAAPTGTPAPPTGTPASRAESPAAPAGSPAAFAGSPAAFASTPAAPADSTAAPEDPRLLPVLPSGAAARDFLEDGSGIIWIGTEEGVFRYDPDADMLDGHLLDPSSPTAPGNYVWQVYEARSGMIWIATRSGLYRHDPRLSAFGHVPKIGAVVSILEGIDGTIWMGTLGSGLIAVASDNGGVQRYTHQNGLPSNNVWALESDAQGHIWIGTEAGVTVLDPRTRRYTRIDLPRGHLESRSVVYDIKRDDGAMWIAGDEDLYRIDTATSRLERHVNTHFPGLVTLQALHVDEAGYVWVGSEGSGLMRYDPHADELVRYPFLAADSTGLHANTVWAIYEDAGGMLWLGTNLGLARLDPTTGTFASFYEPDVMPGAIVYSILRDDDGTLWLGSSHGLLHFDPQAATFRHFDDSYGIGSTEFNRRAAMRSQAGAHLFGGLDGVSVVRTNRIEVDRYVPPVAITQMYRENADGTFDVQLGTDEAIVLDHRDVTFGFQFSALTYTNPRKNVYSYTLEGFDDSWSAASPIRLARYTNIPAGEYTFRVRAAGLRGIWNRDGSAVRLTIRPPFWQTWWFRLFAAGAVLGLVSAAYRFRIAQLTRMQSLRLRIAGDLHDDIGSKLSSIALIIDMVRDRSDLDGAHREELSRVSTVSRELVDALRDIVWFIDPVHERPGEFADKLERTAASLLTRASYSFHAEEGLPLEEADLASRRNIFLIYKEALHNIARHAQASNVAISIRRSADGILLTISDDGLGFDSSAVAPGHGLRNMRRRAVDLDGQLAIQSGPGEGTRIDLSVPLP